MAKGKKHKHTQIPQRPDLLRDSQPAVVVNHHLLRLAVGCAARAVLVLVRLLAQVAFQRHQHELHAGAVLRDLADPFRFYVFERLGRVDLEGGSEGLGEGKAVGEEGRKGGETRGGKGRARLTLKQSIIACVSS